MNIKYCLPIIKSTKDEVLAMIEANKQDYYFLEIWLDYITDLDEAFVSTLSNQYGERLLLLFRRQRLEEPQMAKERRQEYLRHLNSSKSYVDLDVSHQIEDLEFVLNNNLTLQLITSYHNYDSTPEDDTLHEILRRMELYNPIVYKFATFCQTETDAVRLLQLLNTIKQSGKQFVVLGMGVHGVITRIFGTLWGNVMIFAPKSTTEQSAPGQLTREQLENIFHILANK